MVLPTPEWVHGSVDIKDLIIKAKDLTAEAKAKATSRNLRSQGLVLEETLQYVQTKHRYRRNFSEP